MDLNTLWFVLIAVLFTGFFVLEGFDYGVGILLPFLGKTDAERRRVINTIGPVWDGNEVWILTGGRRDLRRLPALVRDAVQRLLPGAVPDPRRADRARRGVRVPQQGRAAPPGARPGTG